MLNPTENEIAVWTSLGVITGAPFYFKNWLDRTRPILAEVVQKKTSALSGIIFMALFAGSFVFKSSHSNVALALLFAAIISFSILYQTAARYQHTMNRLKPESLVNHKASLRQTAGRFLVGAAACLIITKINFAIFILPFLIPFLSPLFIRIQHPTTHLSDSALKEELLALFKEQGVPLSSIRLINSTGINGQINGQINAMIAGSSIGAGPFGRTLFITLATFEKLNLNEIKAVALHEAAHLKLSHPSKRILGSIALMLVSTFWITLPVCFLAPGNPYLIFASILGTLYLQASLMCNLISRQEHEADLMAVSMGASSDALISALNRADASKPQAQGSAITHRVARILSGNLYPTLASRIEAIRSCEVPSHLNPFKISASTLAYSLLVLGVVFWSANVRNEPAKVSHLKETVAVR